METTDSAARVETAKPAEKPEIAAPAEEPETGEPDDNEIVELARQACNEHSPLFVAVTAAATTALLPKVLGPNFAIDQEATRDELRRVMAVAVYAGEMAELIAEEGSPGGFSLPSAAAAPATAHFTAEAAPTSRHSELASPAGDRYGGPLMEPSLATPK